MIVMMAAMNLPPHVTTATDQVLLCARTAAAVLGLQISVMGILIVLTALMSRILGQIARLAQRRVAFPAQVFLGIVQSFVMGMQRAQMLGMNHSLPAIPKSLPKEDS